MLDRSAASRRLPWLLGALVLTLAGATAWWLTGGGGSGDTPRPPDRIVLDDVDAVWLRYGTVGGVVTDIVPDPDHPDQVVVATQDGRIVRVAFDGDATSLISVPLTSLGPRTAPGGERGLLGLAWRERAPEGRELYVSYTGPVGQTQVARMPWRDGQPDLDALVELLEIDQPLANHNGGQIHFGPDDRLYLALGDGGGANDPDGHGQNLATPLGAILRLDVDGAQAVAAADNPFVGRDDADPRIFVFGVRNPWRFAFDPVTDDLWIADVGQAEVEEVTRLAFADAAGANLGWATMEGDRCFSGDADACATPDLIRPDFVYGHDVGCSITGGVVVRDPHLPALAGRYLVSDLCAGTLHALYADGGDVRATALDGGFVMPTTFGVDGAGRVLLGTADGSLYRLEPR